MKTSAVSLAPAFAAALLVSQSCPAQYSGSPGRLDGPYFNVNAGPAFTHDGMVTELTGFAAGNRINYDTGFGVDAAIGYVFNDIASVEFEVGWIGNELDRVQGFTMSDTFLYNAPFMVNVTLQYPIPHSTVTPYVGVGGGGSATTFDTDGFSNGSITMFGNDTDVVFAYQAFAGVRFDLNERMSLGIRYKYFATEDSSFNFNSFNPSGPPVRLGIEGVRTHLVTASFNMKF